MTTCASCGTEYADETTTCPVCGATVAAPTTDAGPGTTPDGPAAPTGADSGSGWPTSASSVPQPPPAPRSPVAAPRTMHPSGLSDDVRLWGLLTHLSALVAAFFGLAFLGPLIVWLIKREEHPFLDHHGREALNFNLSVLLYTVVGAVAGVLFALVTLGIGLIPVVLVAVAASVGWFVVTILAAVKANNGEGYRYPLTIRFVS